MLRKFFLWLTGLLLVIGILNYLCRKMLPYGYADILSYNQLYGAPAQLRITKIQRSGKDSLAIRFAGAAISAHNRFEVYCDGVKLLDQVSPFLTMKPLPVFNVYSIKINSVDSLTINIELPPYPADGSTFNAAKSPPEISAPSLMVGVGYLHSPEDWSWDPFLPDTGGKVKEIHRYLQDSIKINDGDNAEERVLKISKYILSVTTGKYGTPSDSMAALQPIAQLNCVRAGLSHLNCGNYSNIFAAFSNGAKVPARYIECGTLSDGILNGSHVVNEVYLKEHNCWAYVDLTDSIVLVKKRGKFLNAIDIQRLLRYDADDSTMVAEQYHKDSLVRLPFSQASFFSKNAFNYSNKFTFYYGKYSSLTSSRNLINKIINFFYPAAYYTFYSDNLKQLNYEFYLRLYSSYAFLIVFVVWSLSVLYLLRIRCAAHNKNKPLS